jgi:hypothetical protein
MAITIKIPEKLAKEAFALGILTDEHIQNLLQADIDQHTRYLDEHLASMANDPDIQRENHLIAKEFAVTESNGLD